MGEHLVIDNLIGATLGTYLLEQLIEQSEVGAVFIARNRAAGALFRMRILVVPPELTPEDRIVYLGRFQQVANLVASLQHTYILPLVDYGTHSAIDAQEQSDRKDAPWPYLVSPYLPMKSLSTLLAQNGPIDTLRVSRYLDQISAALEYTHQQAVLHGNLTTDCIFLKQDGSLLVADFGVMRILDIGARFIVPDTRESAYGIGMASAPAPERILGQAVDSYTDVYALGAVLYRMLTGHRVFRGKSREEIVQQHLHAPIPSLATWRKDLPQELDGIIARALAKEPAQRFRQPGALANAYHDIVAPNDIQRVPFLVASTSTKSAPGNVGVGLSPARNTATPHSPTLHSPAPNAFTLRSPSLRSLNRSTPISRRRALTFIVAAGGTAAAVVAVSIFGRNFLAGNASSTNTSLAQTPAANTTGASTNGQGGHVLARTSDIPLNSAKTFPISGKSNPGLLIHLQDGRFVAFDSTCTHAGCAVNYISQDKILKCPCHNSEFNPANNAAVVQGPAQTPLASIKISVNANGTITQG